MCAYSVTIYARAFPSLPKPKAQESPLADSSPLFEHTHSLWHSQRLGVDGTQLECNIEWMLWHTQPHTNEVCWPTHKQRSSKQYCDAKSHLTPPSSLTQVLHGATTRTKTNVRALPPYPTLSSNSISESNKHEEWKFETRVNAYCETDSYPSNQQRDREEGKPLIMHSIYKIGQSLSSLILQIWLRGDLPRGSDNSIG